MRRIAVINQKGGVGKTTTTANLGAALAQAGLRVCLVDLDPQGHLTLHFGVELNDEQPSVYDLLIASTPVGDVTRRVRERVTLLPADIDLAAAEVELISVTGREVVLREALQPVENDHDVMLIDCPPSLGVLTINALAAANEVLIPLQTHFFALQGLSRLLETVTLVRQRINPSLRVGGIVLCMHESATRLASEVTDDLARFLKTGRGTASAWANARIYHTCIRRNIKLAESCSFGQTVFDYAPRSNGAIDYANLAAEVLAENESGSSTIPAEESTTQRDRIATATPILEATAATG
jgi:chromosome partitioning protein